MKTEKDRQELPSGHGAAALFLIVAAGFAGAVLYGALKWKGKRAAAISIIGGADGPTSIFLAGKVGDLYSVGAGAAGVVLLLILGIWFFICRKGKKEGEK